MRKSLNPVFASFDLTKVRLLKKTILIIFVYLILSFIWGNQADAADQTSLIVDTVYDQSRVGTFNVGVSIENPAGMSNGLLILTYDPKAVRVLGVTKGDTLNGFLQAENLEETANGKVSIAWAAANGISDSGRLFDLEFRMTSNNATDIQISKIELYDQTGKQINPLLVPGKITRFDGVTFDHPQNISANKEWKIEFSTQVDPGTANKHTIYIVDQLTGNRIDAVVTLNKDRKIAFIKPVDRYLPGNYILYITEQLKTPGGKSIKDAVKVPFTVN